MRNTALAAAMAMGVAACGGTARDLDRDAGAAAGRRDAGGPVGSRGEVGWSPLQPATGDLVTVWSTEAGRLHWGVDGWKAPAQPLWPSGTQAFDEKAVETEMPGPDADGRYRVAIGPLPSGVSSLDFVLRRADGTWDNNGGADYRVLVSATAVAVPDASAPGPAGEDASVVAQPQPGLDAGAPQAGEDAGTVTPTPNPTGNPDSVGAGARKTIALDGKNTGDEWGDDTLLIRDPAADDARFLGANWCAHEPPWDYAALHAAWDDQYLYVGLQFVNVTDVLDPANFGSSNASIHSMDLVQFVAFDTVPGAGYGKGGDMWKKDQQFAGPDLPDYQLYFHSNFSQAGTYLGKWDGTAMAQVTDGLETPGLKGAGGRFFAGGALPGVDPHADDAAPGQYGSPSVDYLGKGHSTANDTFFEVRIPLAALGLTADALDHGTIGLFAANGDGSAVDSIPDDPATSSTPGVSNSNSPLEWDTASDDDLYTAPFARVGHGP